MAEVCAKHDKKLFFRTFVYEPEEIGFLEAAMEEAAKVNERTNNLIVMTKCVPHDWTPYYPFNPVLGKTAGLPQIVEIDLGQEFTGKSKILHCEVDYVKYVMDYSREHGLVGGVARVERKNHLTLGTPNEVNIHAFSRLLHDPDLTKDQLWEEWITKTYGSDVGEYLVPALRRTYDITNITLFPLEQWISNHSLLPDWHYAYGHITSRQNYKWLVTPHQARMRDSLLHPTADTLLKIDHEKDLARELAERSLADLEKVKDKLSPTAYQPLKHYLKLGRDCVEVFREQQLAMFATVRYMNAEESGEVSEDELAQFKSVAEEHIKKLRKWADKMEARYGGGVIPGNPGRARHFANQCEKRLGG
jgi:alpha-glucuronidase